MFNLFGRLAGDRRGAQRHYFTVPLRYRIRNSSTEYSSQTENVSDIGVFFETEHPIGVGAVLDVLLDMPNAVGGELPSLWCTGHVVRVASKEGRRGLGVQFDCFEMVDSNRFACGSVIPLAN